MRRRLIDLCVCAVSWCGCPNLNCHFETFSCVYVRTSIPDDEDYAPPLDGSNLEARAQHADDVLGEITTTQIRHTIIWRREIRREA